MRSTETKPGLQPIARILARAGMLLFCVVLAVAVFFEALRQYLSARYAYGSAAGADSPHTGGARESVLALTMSQKIA